MASDSVLGSGCTSSGVASGCGCHRSGAALPVVVAPFSRTAMPWLSSVARALPAVERPIPATRARSAALEPGSSVSAWKMRARAPVSSPAPMTGRCLWVRVVFLTLLITRGTSIAVVSGWLGPRPGCGPRRTVGCVPGRRRCEPRALRGGARFADDHGRSIPGPSQA